MIDFVQDDVLHWAATYTGSPFHCMICDPPYEIGFMGKAFDKTGISFRPETWAALGEHLLPGAFGMAFGGSRTYHRMACAIEDAGFILHSMVIWCFGSGFPKATRIDTQVDRAAGAERIRTGRPTLTVDGQDKAKRRGRSYGDDGRCFSDDAYMWNKPGWADETLPATPLAATWSGHRYGLQSLKPALEPICVWQKPYAGRPVDSITSTGAGALWIEGGRIQCSDHPGIHKSFSGGVHEGWDRPWRNDGPPEYHETPAGRWPSNLILDPIAAAALGRMSGETVSGGDTLPGQGHMPVTIGATGLAGRSNRNYFKRDTGTAARFFQQCDWALEEAEPFYYCAKASRRERDAGLEGMPEYHVGTYAQDEWSRQHMGNTPDAKRAPVHCNHPTVKPIALARYLATLLLPPAEYAPRRILVPFAGVGSECIGAALAGWDEVVGIEAEEEYVTMGKARARYWLMQPALALSEAAS